MTQKMLEISPAQFRGGGGQVTVVNSQKNHAAVEKQVKMKKTCNFNLSLENT
jgi:hypothetical protein